MPIGKRVEVTVRDGVEGKVCGGVKGAPCVSGLDWLPLEAFNLGSKSGGRSNWCRACFSSHRERLKASGKCVNHPYRDALPELTVCQECVDYGALKRERLKASGKCAGHPDRDALPGLTLCQECVDYGASYRERLKASGKCYGHPDRDALPGATKCQECVDRPKRYWARVVSLPGVFPGAGTERRKSILNRFGGLCVYCLTRAAVLPDHAINVWDARSTNYDENLMPCCVPCNKSKRARNLFEDWLPPAFTPDGRPMSKPEWSSPLRFLLLAAEVQEKMYEFMAKNQSKSEDCSLDPAPAV